MKADIAPLQKIPGLKLLGLLLVALFVIAAACKDRQQNGNDEQPADSRQLLETEEKPADREAEALASKYGKKSAIVIAQLRRGVDFARANGVEKLIEVLKNPDDQRRASFVSGNYYIWIFRTDFKSNAIVIAHPINKAIENRDFFAIKDADGKMFMKDIIRMANYKESGWVLYKWAHPSTMKAEAKLTYFYRIGDYILNDGFYLKD